MKSVKDKIKKRMVSFEIPQDLYDVIQKKGKKYERKVSAQVRQILRDWADQEQTTNQ